MQNKLIPWMLLLSTFLAFLCFKKKNERLDHPATYEIQNFSLVAQPDEVSCGPTSALMVLKSYGISPSLTEVSAQTKTHWFQYKERQIGATTLEYIVLALRHFGIESKIMRGKIDSLKHYVSEDHPVICHVRTGRALFHYVVVIGFTEKEIIIADPGGGNRWSMPTKQFYDAWNFTADLYGASIDSKCSFCNGTGKITKLSIGPLGNCDFCGGTGIETDYIKTLFAQADMYPCTMIVPKFAIGSINTIK